MKLFYILPITLFSHITGFAQSYSGGSGTIGDPYKIATKNDLQYLSEHSGEWSKNFKQTADILFTSADFASGGNFYNSGSFFIPIGSNTTNFSGTYDGGGFIVDSLKINRPSEYYVGLFGLANNATIQKLGVTNCSVTGLGNTGGLAGTINGTSMVSKCFSTGTVNGAPNNYMGGLIGRSNSAQVTNSYSRANVVGNSSSGIGYGGLLGFNSNGTISNCYAIGNVSGHDFVGGLCGSNSGVITNCFCVGTLTLTGGTQIGGLLASNGGNAINCFWDTDVSGTFSSYGGAGLTTAQMQTANNFTTAGWDFAGEITNGSADFWTMGACNASTGEYPMLTWELFNGGGNGSLGNPYLIGNKRDLKTLSENSCLWGENYKQTADIYFVPADFAQGGDFYNNGNGFIPIGTQPYINNFFDGTYDGDGHVIDGLTINRPGTDGVGLFGAARGDGAFIRSLGLTNVNVIGHYLVGGLVGTGQDTLQLTDCFVTGSISGIGIVGGLTGDSYGITITKCHADATVSGLGSGTTGDIGGLMGFDFGSFVYRSYAKGTVIASVQNGGFIGRAQSTTLVDNYSTANVTGGYLTGGFLGAVDGTILQNCYSTGLVTGSGNNVGGFSGAGAGGSATNCFWDQETSGQPTSSLGTAKSSLQMKTESTFTNATWDFEGETTNGSSDYWKMGQCNNNGYPVFQWQESVAYPGLSFGSINGNVQDSATICYNNTAFVSVGSWFNITWYDSITAGNSVATGSNFTTPQLTNTTVYYPEVSNGTCVNPFRLAFTVVVHPENTSSQTLVFCNGSGSVTVGTNTYTTTGIYVDTLTAANGCDSIVTTNLTIQTAVNAATSTNGLTISASAAGATYQWINCATNSPIAGETGQSFTATANGSYAVIVTEGSCSDTSACVSISTVGLTEHNLLNALIIYPNPSKGIFMIEGLDIGSSLEVVSLTGEKLFIVQITDTETKIDLSDKSNGVYFIQTSNGLTNRLIKQD